MFWLLNVACMRNLRLACSCPKLKLLKLKFTHEGAKQKSGPNPSLKYTSSPYY